MTFDRTVTLGNLHDDLRNQPGSWWLAGFLPEFSAQKSERPHRGPNGTPRRAAEITHLSLQAFLYDFIRTTVTVKEVIWGDGVVRLTRFFISAVLGDQQEHDKLCGESSQTCKLCICPKSEFDKVDGEIFDSESGYRHRSAFEMKEKILETFTKPFRRENVLKPAMFVEDEPGAEIRLWKLNPDYDERNSQADYEYLRKQSGNAHMVENAFWNVPSFDILQQEFFL